MSTENTNVAEISIIPMPNSIILGKGKFVYDKDVVLCANGEASNFAEYFASVSDDICGFLPPIKESSDRKNIEFTISTDKELGCEGYSLKITPQKILVSANETAGLFYATETLRQLMPPQAYGKVASLVNFSLPCLEIKDVPRFAWRGLHLDVARHFMPIEFLEKFIDLMAIHKLNTFHLHLTEDQGWRIEIKKYPKLTEVGAWRDGTVIGHTKVLPRTFDNIRHGGFYTQQQLKDLVAYAAKKNITIIPEIGLPGHSMAALTAYPQYSCTGQDMEVQKRWGVFEDIYCAGNDGTFEFLQNILDEVVEIFPSKYIHIGGDEAPKKRWQSCPKCQQRIKYEGLANEDELQSYFIKRIEKHLNSKGRDIIGWDEILEGGLAPNATVMSWRSEDGGIQAANAGHKVVMSPVDFCYLDYYQSKDADNEPLTIGGFLPLEKVYSYDPIPAKIDEDKKHFVMGVQGNVWTEYMKTPQVVEYMTYPRASAIAEVGWTQPESKDENNFKQRLKAHYKRLDELKVNYRNK